MNHQSIFQYQKKTSVNFERRELAVYRPAPSNANKDKGKQVI